MSELDPLTEQQLHLFLRIDAAMPTDPVLRAAAEFWLEKRKGKLLPAGQDMAQLPQFIRPHVFEAHLAVNGDQHWITSGAGNLARHLLGIEGQEPGEVPDRRMAVRLRRLFDLVARTAEPYSVMFEVKEADGSRQLVEIYAAPLATPEKREHHVFAVLNSRAEAQQ
jgi:hypothetical protein